MVPGLTSALSPGLTTPGASPGPQAAAALPAHLLARLLDSLPAAERAALETLAAPAREGKALSLMADMKIKLALTARLALPEALVAWRGLTGADDRIGLRPLAIRGLWDAVQQGGGVLQVFHEGGQPFTCRPPAFDGAAPPDTAPPLHGWPRVVFAGLLRDVTVHSRSPAIRQGDTLIFDLQPGELDSVPVEMAFDPVVFHRAGDRVQALEDTRPEREWRLDRAWSLMGINSVSFGHWMIEHLPQFLAACDLPQFRGLPVLIDRQMPAQHRQSLELFGQGRFRLIEVPRGVRVRVGRLHVVSNWFYAPHLMTTDQGLDISTFVPQAAKLGALYTRMAARFDALRPALPSTGVFWARGPARHRSIGNLAELTAALAARGITQHLPETRSFADQIALLRGTDRVVLQNGSGMHAFFLARPGTRVLFLSHTALPFIALFNELLLHMGHEMTVLTGPFRRRAGTYLDQSDYDIPLDRLGALLDGWDSAAPARAPHPAPNRKVLSA